MAAQIKDMSDFELIKACIDGNERCFEELVERYKNLVYSIVLRMTNDREDANDLAQEVFVKIYRNLGKYYPEFKFSTWVIRITTNHVIDYNRQKKQQYIPLDEVDYDISAPADSLPESEYLKKERAKALRDAINGLPDMYRVPIVLYHGQGLSYQEISNALCEPLSKVKNRIFRGRKLLREVLGRGREGELYET